MLTESLIGHQVQVGTRYHWTAYLKPWWWRRIWQGRLQTRTIVASDATTLTVGRPWSEPPKATAPVRTYDPNDLCPDLYGTGQIAPYE